MYVTRVLATGALSAPFGDGAFTWQNGHRCETAAYHGAARAVSGSVVERVYSVVRLADTGSGPSRTPGAPTYDSGNDRVTMQDTLSDPALTGAAKASAVNAEAERRINLAYPPSDQIWGALVGVRLTWKKAVAGQNLTAGEQTKLTAIDAAADFIDQIRTARLALIANGGKTMAQITDNANWPAQP